MTWFIGQSLSILILAFFVGLAAGYLVWGRRFELLDGAPRANQQEIIDVAGAERTSALSETTQKLGDKAAEAQTEQAEAQPDDLEMISGINGKAAKALRAAGLTSFSSIATADDEMIRAALSAKKVKLDPSLSSWAAQARLLADGDLAGYEALRDSLSAEKKGRS